MDSPLRDMEKIIKFFKEESQIETTGGLIAYGIAVIAFSRLIDWLIEIMF